MRMPRGRGTGSGSGCGSGCGSCWLSIGRAATSVWACVCVSISNAAGEWLSIMWHVAESRLRLQFGCCRRRMLLLLLLLLLHVVCPNSHRQANGIRRTWSSVHMHECVSICVCVPRTVITIARGKSSIVSDERWGAEAAQIAARPRLWGHCWYGSVWFGVLCVQNAKICFA